MEGTAEIDPGYGQTEENGMGRTPLAAGVQEVEALPFEKKLDSKAAVSSAAKQVFFGRPPVSSGTNTIKLEQGFFFK